MGTKLKIAPRPAFGNANIAITSLIPAIIKPQVKDSNAV